MISVRYLIIIGVDELYFHHKRTLPRWERIGHPLDTITVLACFCWVLFVAPTGLNISIYVGLSIFSCVFILKDEHVHHRECGAVERWLHDLLFTLHPLTLISAGLLWPALHNQAFVVVRYEGWERSFMIGNVSLIILFFFYQTIYWNLLWRPNDSTSESFTPQT